MAKNPLNTASFMSQSYNLDQEAKAEIMAHTADCDIGHMQMVDRPYQSSLTCFMMLVMVVMLFSKQVQRKKGDFVNSRKQAVFEANNLIPHRMFVKVFGKYVLQQLFFKEETIEVAKPQLKMEANV